MADFKAYENTVQVSDVPLANFDRSYSKLHEAISTFSDARMKEAQTQANFAAAKAGQAAGSKLGFEATAPITEADKAFNQAAEQAHQAVIHTEIQTQIMKAREAALTNLSPGSVKQFQTTVAALKSGIMEQIPEGSKAYAENLFNYYATTNGLEVGSAVRSLNKQITLSNLLEYNGKVDGAMFDAASKGDAISAAAFYADKLRKNKTALETGNISGAQYYELEKQTQNQLNEEYVLGQFKRELLAGRGREAYKKLISEELPDITDTKERLPFAQATSIRAKAHSMMEAFNQENGINKSAIKDQSKDLLTAALNGYPKDDEFSQKSALILANAQNLDEQDQRVIKETVQDASVAKSVMKAAYQSSDAQIDELKDKIHEHVQGAGADLTTNHLENLNKIITKLDNFKEARKKDLAGWSMQLPAVQKAFEAQKLAEQGNTSLAGNGIAYPGLAQQQFSKGVVPFNTDPYYSMLKSQRGITKNENELSLLPATKAEGFVAEVNAMPAEQKFEAMDNLLQQFPDKYRGIVLNDLKKNKLDIADVVYYTALKDSPSQAPFIYAAANSKMEDLNKAVKEKDRSGLRSTVITKLQSYSSALAALPGNITQPLNQVYDATEKLALVYMQRGDSASTAAEKAANTTINAKYNFGSFNGPQFFVPKNVNVSQVKDAADGLIRSINHQDLTLPPRVSAGQTTPMRTEDYYSEIRNYGHLALNTLGDGMVLLDASNSKVLDKNGEVIGFQFSDLATKAGVFSEMLSRMKVDDAKREAKALDTALRK